jgi:hypothetical protein
MHEISWILVGAVMLANERLERVVIKGIYTTYVYILKYMRMSFSQLLAASNFKKTRLQNIGQWDG